MRKRDWTCAQCGIELDRDANLAQNTGVAGIHQLSEAGYVLDNRGENVRLCAWSYSALLQRVQLFSTKRVSLSGGVSSEMARFTNCNISTFIHSLANVH